jgi:predicted metal-dependent hydrolase
MSPEEHRIQYGKHDIAFTLCRVDRKTLEISVHPDMSVVVKAHPEIDIDKINDRLKKRARWIIKQQRYFKQFHPRMTPRYYISGETHFYLGKRYQLKVIKDDLRSVKLKNGAFLVHTKDPSQKTVQIIMQNWYRNKAKEQFRIRFEACWPTNYSSEFEKPKMQVKLLKKRWGSLSAGGVLTLNLDLVKAPKECIDYVITHELCHLKHPHHDDNFYQLLETLIPDWEKRKHKLEMFMS